MIELPFGPPCSRLFSSISFDYLDTQGNSCAPKPAMSLHYDTAPDTATNYSMPLSNYFIHAQCTCIKESDFQTQNKM